jgi:hypothetical protein
MEFLHASIALLASMVLVLAGMVGWIYWQQTRMFQNMNSIALVIGDLNQTLMSTIPQPARPELVTLDEPTETVQKADVPTSDEEEEEDDDRLSVNQESADIVAGPPEPLDTDGLQDKSKKELQEILTKRGIPYGKADNKNVLISLLKATA